ncbi:zinc finger protein 236 [Patella vulgata]|uniref:zinc finger protein 236 n=1 Tax=Patella vulgata TaxID=6465 RepID=UPI0021803B3E|nr:zinc finger protein 236 [Patella vulgata]
MDTLTHTTRYCDVCYGGLGDRSYRIITSSMVNEFDEVIIAIGMTPTREKNTYACQHCSYKIKRIKHYDQVLKTRLVEIRKKRSEICEDLRRIHVENKGKTPENQIITVQRPNTFAQSQVKGFRCILPASNSPILMKSNPVPVTVNLNNNLNTIPCSSPVKSTKSANISKLGEESQREVSPGSIKNLNSSGLEIPTSLQSQEHSSSKIGIQKEVTFRSKATQGQSNLKTGINEAMTLPTQTVPGHQNLGIGIKEAMTLPTYLKMGIKKGMTLPTQTKPRQQNLEIGTNEGMTLPAQTTQGKPNPKMDIKKGMTLPPQTKPGQQILEIAMNKGMTLTTPATQGQQNLGIGSNEGMTLPTQTTKGQQICGIGTNEGMALPTQTTCAPGQPNPGIGIKEDTDMECEEDDIIMPKSIIHVPVLASSSISRMQNILPFSPPDPQNTTKNKTVHSVTMNLKNSSNQPLPISPPTKGLESSNQMPMNFAINKILNSSNSSAVVFQVTERTQTENGQSTCISSQTHFLLPMTLPASSAVGQPSIEESTPENSGITEEMIPGQPVVGSNTKEGLVIPLTQGHSDTGSDIHIKEEMKVEEDDILMPKVCFSESNDSKIYSQAEETNNAITFHQCAICNEIFQQYADLVQHNKVHVKEEKTDYDIDKECHAQGKASVHTLQQCNLCDKNFKSSTDLEKHCEVHMKDEELKSVNDNSTLNSSIFYIGEKPYKCDVCNKSFLHKGSLQRHTPLHTGEKLFACSVCCKSFTRNSILQDHMRIHTGQRQFKCDVCSKSFYDINGLKRHKRIHTGVKPYKCDVCGKAFIQSGTLRTHLKTHFGEKSHKCDICDTSFVVRGNLLRHMKCHDRTERDKPYKCDICGKSFIFDCYLNEHMKTHTDHKPYKCDVCGKSFSINRYLQTHVKIHSSDKLFKCDVCSKLFKSNRSLQKHIITSHTEDKHL